LRKKLDKTLERWTAATEKLEKLAAELQTQNNLFRRVVAGMRLRVYVRSKADAWFRDP
jgi:hypothetical protein